jgi:hypothetical protein
MKTANNSRTLRIIPLLITFCLVSFPAQAQYGGGTGEPNDPYLIYTAEQMNAIGTNPDHWDRHFKLISDIDLSSYTGTEFNIIGYYASHRDHKPFAGVFDGNGHTISNFSYTSSDANNVGLFGYLHGENAQIKDLGLTNPNVDFGRRWIGSLAGWLREGTIAACYIEGGSVSGYEGIGGLVGQNGGNVTNCYSTSTVSGNERVGGLVGDNSGSITASYSTGSVNGDSLVGGLVGVAHQSSITTSYSTGSVNGVSLVGGLVGENEGSITSCYSTGTVSGNRPVGGLVGGNSGSITTSFWDIQTSGQPTSADGTGLTTPEMQDISTYLSEGWDFVDEVINGTCDYWQISAGEYPRLRYTTGGSPAIPEGLGTAEQPYLIRDAWDLGTVWFKPMAHYRLETSLNLSETKWSIAVVPWFGGTFDGNGHVISNLHIQGIGLLGLFGQLGNGAEVKNLGVMHVNITSGASVGGLAYRNSGAVFNCYSTGSVTGSGSVGGLVGSNGGSITMSYSTATVTGDRFVGGLVGSNWGSSITSSYSTGSVSGNDDVRGMVGVGGLVGLNISGSHITSSYSTGSVSGDSHVGGLVGYNRSSGITASYSTGSVNGDSLVGGLVGVAHQSGITTSYSTGSVNGVSLVGGLVGENSGSITWSYSIGSVSGNDDVGGLVGAGGGGMDPSFWDMASFWDIQTSGQTTSAGGVGLTTMELMDPNMLGLLGFANDPNWVLDAGHDYPRLAWEGTTGEIIQEPTIDWLNGSGTDEAPYEIDSVDQLILLSTVLLDKACFLTDKCFVLTNHLDLSGRTWYQAAIPYFEGRFDGNGYVISHLAIQGEGNLGLFGHLGSSAEVLNLGLEAVDVNGAHVPVGGLVGYNEGSITDSYCNGIVCGGYNVGGLVGYNEGSITDSYSTGTVSGTGFSVGGLVGNNGGSITTSYSTGSVTGDGSVGGLAGDNWGSITTSYSTGSVNGVSLVGGLVGGNYGSITSSFWDMYASGQATSAGGTGLTTAEMQTASTFLEAGWDFVDEIENGTEDIWWINEGNDYPRLWWELIPEN